MSIHVYILHLFEYNHRISIAEGEGNISIKYLYNITE